MPEPTNEHPIGPFPWTPATISVSVPLIAVFLLIVQVVLGRSLVDAQLEFKVFVAFFVGGSIYGVTGLWGGLANGHPRKVAWAGVGIVINLLGLAGCWLFLITGGFSPGV